MTRGHARPSRLARALTAARIDSTMLLAGGIGATVSVLLVALVCDLGTLSLTMTL